MTTANVARPKLLTIEATGGDEVYDLPLYQLDLLYRVHRFLVTGEFEVSAGTTVVEFLLQAGGGGGGGTNGRGAHGGGAGGLLLGRHSVDASEDVGSGDGVYPVVVGNRGTRATNANDGQNGGNSSAFGIVAVGGGFGAQGSVAPRSGGSGGSGGGGIPSGAGTPGQGQSGDRTLGFSSTGSNGGGLNQALDFDGTPQVYAGFGDRGFRSSPVGVPLQQAEFGRGGRGAYGDGNGTFGGMDGGPGIVIIRYPLRRL